MHTLPTALLLSALASAPALAQTPPVLGAPQSSVSAQASAGNLAGTGNCGDTVIGSSSAAFGCTALMSSSSAEIAGAAGFGAVHASVTAQGSTSGTLLGSSGQINAFFSDAFALRGPANTSAVLHGSFVISGAVTASASGAAEAPSSALASYSVQASIGSWNGAQDGSAFTATTGVSTTSNANGQILLVDSPVSFGPDGWAVMTLSVLAQIHAEGSARAYQACSNCPTVPGEYFAEAAFGHTVYWGGIVSITVGDVPLASFDYLASASGVDYRVSTEFAGPVPEPAAPALLAAGLLVLALRRRRVTRGA